MYGPYGPPPWWGYPGGQSTSSPDILEKAFKIVERLERKEEKKKRKAEEEKKKKEAPKPAISAHTLAMMVLVGPWIGMGYAIMVYFAFKGLAYLIK